MAPPIGENQDDEPADGLGDHAPAGPAEETTLRVGVAFHLFHVVRLVGRGGTSEVYEVRFKGATWGLKVPRRGFEFTPEQRTRFEEEAELLLQMRHPNVIDVQEYGFNEGIFWIRMELLDGLDLREAITRLGAMSIGLVGAWLVQAAHGVHQCHMFGIVHRDIKPENIFITRENVVKLLDFGIVKRAYSLPTHQTGQGTPPPIGTAPYMSPEQARGGKVSSASDVYALGMTMVELLLGEHPFLLGGRPYDFWTMLQMQVLEEVPPLTTWDFPPGLSGVAERALSKHPSGRQPNGLQFAEELLRECVNYLREHPEEEPNPGEPTIAWLLDADIKVPSFGTGPEPGRRSAPPPRGSKPPADPRPARPSAEPEQRLVIRFGTVPTSLSEPSEPRERDTDPDAPPSHAHDEEPEGLERDTDPSGLPMELRRFDTISLPPELRDPSAVRALAAHRPAHRRPPESAPAARQLATGRPRSPQGAEPHATGRAALLPAAGAAPAGRPATLPPPPASNTPAGGPRQEGTPTTAIIPLPQRGAPQGAPSAGADATRRAPASEVPRRGPRDRLRELRHRLRRPALFAFAFMGVLLLGVGLTPKGLGRRDLPEGTASAAIPRLLPPAPSPAAPGSTSTAAVAPAAAPSSTATALPTAAATASPAASAATALQAVTTATATPAPSTAVAASPPSPRTSAPAPPARAPGSAAPRQKRASPPAAASSTAAAPPPAPARRSIFRSEN